jgi:small redox-active disulfide protein 2
MQIAILGTGCRKCEVLGESVRVALAQRGLSAQVEKVTDLAKIASYGVMSTPALVIDGKVVSVGKALSSDAVLRLLPA